MDAKRTRTGWIVDITNRRGDCLEAGGVCGRRVLYRDATIRRCGINPDADPSALYNDCVSNLDKLLHAATADKVIRRGHTIA